MCQASSCGFHKLRAGMEYAGLEPNHLQELGRSVHIFGFPSPVYRDRCSVRLPEIAAKRKLHPTLVSTWKRQAIEGMANERTQKIYVSVATDNIPFGEPFYGGGIEMAKSGWSETTSLMMLGRATHGFIILMGTTLTNTLCG